MVQSSLEGSESLEKPIGCNLDAKREECDLFVRVNRVKKKFSLFRCTKFFIIFSVIPKSFAEVVCLSQHNEIDSR